MFCSVFRVGLGSVFSLFVVTLTFTVCRVGCPFLRSVRVRLLGTYGLLPPHWTPFSRDPSRDSGPFTRPLYPVKRLYPFTSPTGKVDGTRKSRGVVSGDVPFVPPYRSGHGGEVTRYGGPMGSGCESVPSRWGRRQEQVCQEWRIEEGKGPSTSKGSGGRESRSGGPPGMSPPFEVIDGTQPPRDTGSVSVCKGVGLSFRVPVLGRGGRG